MGNFVDKVYGSGFIVPGLGFRDLGTTSTSTLIGIIVINSSRAHGGNLAPLTIPNVL